MNRYDSEPRARFWIIAHPGTGTWISADEVVLVDLKEVWDEAHDETDWDAVAIVGRPLILENEKYLYDNGFIVMTENETKEYK